MDKAAYASCLLVILTRNLAGLSGPVAAVVILVTNLTGATSVSRWWLLPMLFAYRIAHYALFPLIFLCLVGMNPVDRFLVKRRFLQGTCLEVVSSR